MKRFRLPLLALVAACGLASAAEDAPWRRMAEADLAAIRDTIDERHPGPLDTRNPAFAQWHARGYVEATQLTAKAGDFAGYERALRYYVNGFRDGHLGLSLDMQSSRAWWPGIVMAYRGGAWRVHHVADDVPSPRVGDALVACDGMAADAFAEKNLLPYYGNPDIPSSKVRVAPRVFVEMSTEKPASPASCTFRGADGEHAVAMQWRRTQWDRIAPLLQAAGVGTPPALGVRRVAGNGAWVSLPSFDAQGARIDAMKSTMAQLAKHRDAKYLVVDVRGNGGGSSYWGGQTLEAIYGEAWGAWRDREAQRKEAATYVEFRVSQATADHFRDEMPRMAQGAGKDSDTYRYFERIVAALDDAVAEGRPMLDDRAIQRALFPPPPAESGAAPVPAYHGRVFFLTDASCASACLDFADRLLCAPDVVHVGGATSGDTTYMDVASRRLPSGSGTFGYATKVYRERARGHNASYAPALAWSGDPGDTASIEAWIAGLAQRADLPAPNRPTHC
jgi:hypothetical protein